MDEEGEEASQEVALCGVSHELTACTGKGLTVRLDYIQLPIVKGDMCNNRERGSDKRSALSYLRRPNVMMTNL